MGPFTNYVIKEGEGGFQMITLDYEGGAGVLANDYVIKNIRIFHKFLLSFGQILSLIFKIFSGFGCTN